MWGRKAAATHLNHTDNTIKKRGRPAKSDAKSDAKPKPEKPKDEDDVEVMRVFTKIPTPPHYPTTFADIERERLQRQEERMAAQRQARLAAQNKTRAA
jgi:hypothetical protein